MTFIKFVIWTVRFIIIAVIDCIKVMLGIESAFDILFKDLQGLEEDKYDPVEEAKEIDRCQW